MIKYVLAIDPGTTMSGVCLVRIEDYKPLWSLKDDNKNVCLGLYNRIRDARVTPQELQCVIERMQGNNMPVSSDVFLTCEWIGRFDYHYECYTARPTEFVFRRDEYREICGNIYSHNDKGIRQGVVERFAYGLPNFGKGNSKAPGWFYGFSKDGWSAYAIAVTWIDIMKRNGAI